MVTGQTVRLGLDAIGTLTERVLLANGFSAAQAQAIATLVAAAERDGCRSHGLMRVPTYVAAVKSGRIDPQADPRVVARSPTALRIDGGGGYSTLAVHRHTDELEALARTSGMAAMLVTRAHHLAALWYDVEGLASAGLIALAFVAARPVIGVFGGRGRALGTNPFAFAAPRAGDAPFVVDFATSAIARGEIQLAARSGEPIPPGVALDVDGEPTTDAERALAGTMLPFGGGHKGSAVAMLVEMMAVVLTGGRFGFEAVHDDQRGDGGPLGTGQTLLAFDPVALGSGDPSARMAALIDHLRSTGASRLPGERRLECRARHAREGVAVDARLLAEIEALA